MTRHLILLSVLLVVNLLGGTQGFFVCRTEGNTQYVCSVDTYCCNNNSECCTSTRSKSDRREGQLLFILILSGAAGLLLLCIKVCCKNSSDDHNTETTAQYEEVKQTPNVSAKLNPERRFVLVPQHHTVPQLVSQ